MFSRENLAVEGGYRPRGEHVDVHNRVVHDRGASKYLFADKSAEFAGRLVDLRVYHHGTRIDFSRPGKPTDNAVIEMFDGSMSDECVNVHWFEMIAEALQLIEALRIDLNESRPHMALGNLSPNEYAYMARTSVDPRSSTTAGN